MRFASKVRPSTRNILALWNIREHTAPHDELVFSGCWFEAVHLYLEDSWIDGGSTLARASAAGVLALPAPALTGKWAPPALQLFHSVVHGHPDSVPFKHGHV